MLVRLLLFLFPPLKFRPLSDSEASRVEEFQSALTRAHEKERSWERYMIDCACRYPVSTPGAPDYNPVYWACLLKRGMGLLPVGIEQALVGNIGVAEMCTDGRTCPRLSGACQKAEVVK